MALPLIPIVSALSSAAPFLGKLLGGSKGAKAAQEVANIACAVTGATDPSVAVNRILDDTPTGMQMRIQFQQQVYDNKERLETLYVADKQHARDTHKDSKMPAVNTFMLTLMVTGLGAAILLLKLEPIQRELLMLLLGAVLREWGGSLGYWHGASRSSDADTLERLK